MKKRILTTLLLIVTLLTANTVNAQAPTATPEEAITGLLNRIGGDDAANLFEIVIDASLAEDGKDVFVITAQNGKPCIKGNNQLSVATGINWYLNHVAHINLTWNNLTTDLSKAELPLPQGEDKHVCNTTYRYDFNTCTFSYSMAFWTWERWQQEIDWMALHGINAPLNLVGLDVVTRKFLRELGVSENDINAYIAGPGFIAWFAMNNLEGWGGTINANDVTMNGNPDWWYTRQEQLCRDMLQRMRELGMQPVIPGFSGQVPNCIVNYSINGFSSGDVVDNGTWAGGYTRPDILKPNTESYRTFATVYYKHLHEVMGVSEFYSIDPFHEGSLPSGVSNETCYPNIMVELDNYYNDVVSQEDKAKNNVDEAPKWIIQYWQGVPQSGAFSAMSNYGDRFIGLDLFSDAPGKAKWNTDYFQGRPYIFCMLHNFGGRSGLHGRLESTMNDYFRALAKGNNMQGIGATPEGTETNPILYDMLFELPWMNPATRPTADEWLQDYAYARYGVENSKALSALKYLKKSVWACPTDQQGTSEAVILARPNWTVGSVSSWSTSAIYWDTQDVLLAADELSSITDLNTEDGIANYNYDFIDVTRQAMVDYAAELLPLINASRNNNVEYTRLYQLYLQLMLDLDKMLSYDENFKLERWTSLARNIANEVAGTTENDRRWLEWNARTQITVWSKGDTDLHDYSNRCWAGLIKDYHYKRWKQFFESNGNAFSGGWYSGFEYPWTVDFTNYNYSTVTIPDDMTATEKAKETFGNYFGRVKGKDKNYIFPMGITRDATKSGVITEVYRGQEVELPLETGKNVTISSVWIDLNNDGAASNNEALTANGNKVTIPADAVIGQTKAKVTYSDGTVITFNIALIEDITDARTVTAASAGNGSVAIEGTNELTVTTTEAVKITATANTGYNFNNWTNAANEVVSNNNPFIYYGKEDAAFTANFIQDKWGVVACNGSFSGDIAGYSQFIHNLTFAYYNREPETIFEATTAPTEIFNTIPQIINVPQGASFDVKYNNGGSDGLKYCYFRAFIDLNADGDFDDEGELLKEVGTNGAENTAVCSNKINVLLPYDTPLGITHMRLRFDGAWDNSNNPSGRGAKDASIRPVYEIIINVTDKSDKAATINVETNNQEWGTVEVWTDETPDGSTGTEWNVTKGVQFYLRATKVSEDAEFLGWYDQYGRLLTTELEHTMYAREDATYTARFRKFLEIDGWQMEYRTDKRRANRIVLTKVRESGKNDLVIPETVEILGEPYTIVGFDNNLFNNNKELWSITLPKSIEFVSNNTLYSCFVEGNVASTTGKYESGNNNFIVKELGDNKVSSSNGWIIEIDGKTDGSTFNHWGSALIATGETPMHVGTSSFPNGFQIYLGESGNVVAKINDGTENAINGVIVSGNFKATIEYDKTNVTITITCSEQTSSFTKAAQMNDIEKLSFAIPQGVELDINIKETEEPNPFEGCTNLDTITIDEECAAYEVHEDGNLYNTGGTLISELTGKEKGKARRELAVLIEEMETLTELVATYNPTGTKTAIQLSTTAGEDYYIYSNAEIREGAIGNLLDNDNDSYIHTTWEKNSADGLHHYLRVYLGKDPALTDFSFSYITRTNINTEKPKQITVAGCDAENGTYETIAVLTDLPQASTATFESSTYSARGYKYLRFMVDDTYRDLSNSGHKAYSMAKFDLYKVSASADVFSYLEGGITDEQAATAYDALLDAIYVFDNGTTADEMVAAEAALQSAYNTLNDLLKAAIPVTLTTDEENPKLYKIFIKRTADVTVLKYSHNDSKVAVENTANNSSWQAWYFMGSTRGVTIHPYNADGKVLSADNTSNDPAKVWAVEKGEKNFYEWKFVSRADGYYNIQAHDGSNYFSNNGGTGNKMGFWSGSPESDGGSLFKFVDAEFGNSNERFYQLSDVKPTMTDGTNIYGGTSVGLYTGGTEYREAYTAASTIIAAGNTSDSKECYNAYKALRAANEDLSYNAADPNKLYYIISKASNDYCKGEYVHTNRIPTARTCYWGTNTYDQNHLLFDAKTDIDQLSLAVFQFEATNTQGEYKIKNLHTGLYVKAFAGTHMGNSDTTVVKIAGYADGQVTLKIGNNSPMHAQQDYGVIVQWDAAANNASLWTIDEVTNLEEIAYNTTISNLEERYGYSTLYLNYDVTIPAGISAYRADNIDEGYIHMEEVTGVIPAQTAVVLHGKAGSYALKYTVSDAEQPSNLLKGTLWKETISKKNGFEYYILANGNKGVGMYIPTNADNESQFINQANKAYLSYEQPAAPIAAFSFRGIINHDGPTTEIDEVESKSEEVQVIYDLQGRKLNAITKPGLYIINGNKILVK